MTFWDWWESNRQKSWGQLTILAAVLGMALQGGGANSFLSAKAIAIASFLCFLVNGISGGGTTKSAFNNTTAERVAASAATAEVAKADIAVAKAETATAMKVAIEAVPAAVIPQLTGVKP